MEDRLSLPFCIADTDCCVQRPSLGLLHSDTQAAREVEATHVDQIVGHQSAIVTNPSGSSLGLGHTPAIERKKGRPTERTVLSRRRKVTKHLK